MEISFSRYQDHKRKIPTLNGLKSWEQVNQNWFLSLEDAKLKCEAFGIDYDHFCPHSSIGLKTPVEFMNSIGTPNQPIGS